MGESLIMEKRRKRVVIDKDVEVLIVNNSPRKRIILGHDKVASLVDLEQSGDEEYITVGELKLLVNTNRKLFEGFSVLITEILHDEFTLEDLVSFVGLEKAYAEYWSLKTNAKDKSVQVGDIEAFILKSNEKRFDEILSTVNSQLKEKIIFLSINLFREGQFKDYSKMQTIRKLTDEDLFDDLEIEKEFLAQ